MDDLSNGSSLVWFRRHQSIFIPVFQKNIDCRIGNISCASEKFGTPIGHTDWAHRFWKNLKSGGTRVKYFKNGSKLVTSQVAETLCKQPKFETNVSRTAPGVGTSQLSPLLLCRRCCCCCCPCRIDRRNDRAL